MRIAKVIGSVTLSRCHPAMAGSRLRCVLPVDDIAQIDSDDFSGSELLVTWDELGAGNGDLIALAEGPEAAQPFQPQIKCIDAYNAAILDHIDLQ
ncbi:Ethanolamine utilization protein EutN/carboxysome [Rosistilla oblonga]|uniref:Ethanolamine utilization protein EutN/carboxysome n=2 Tax=Rosistilla TaxID=2795779 RepID=A0A518IYE0_9BACT|nr:MULTISPECIES: EutN/CcmL family microcompartment protein [Rosistilla]QDS89476.1 Ethanolamine utilization protein EutN/carboxysome [Rosistilla ulvae]QDV13708.1 Ethanolamine utilization protein EutN/carboxysome [Rosistilla oblonga]QDV58107.1 Ethanolamine utilization protein EutN/carboxysome [Rosistilla oblonga]